MAEDLLKQQRRDLVEIPPPDLPGVCPVTGAESVLDATRLEELRELCVRFEQRVFSTAADPQQLQPIIHNLRVGNQRLEIETASLRRRHDAERGAEARDTAEEIGAAQPEAERLPASHRESRDGAVLAIGV